MATVHRAIERGIEGFERVVALKRLLPHLAEDEGFVRAFVREAKLASLLQHGNIVQLYELGRVGPSYFISMEYIPGRDLRMILRQARRVCGPPPVEIALALLTELLDALDYAHSQCGADGKPLGLVHRDISPSNLLVSQTGHLKVIDFGIAKATLGHMMTHTGRIKGKLSYMAPEALSGRTLDGRSDLFSASVIAHELLTATPLFAAKDDFQTIDRLQNMQPALPSARNPSCPPELDEIVLRGLAKDPTQRWRSAAEMRAALAELAIDHHRLATNREVCDWVEEAFEMALPSRLRLPHGPAVKPSRGTTTAEQRRASQASADSEDEVMDLVWGITGPRSPMEVLLDEVPDVSARFARVELEDRDDPLASQPLDRIDEGMVASLSLGAVEEEPTNAMARPSFESTSERARSSSSEHRITFRTSTPHPMSNMSSATEHTPQSGLVVQSQGGAALNGRMVTRPPAWAVGTSPTRQQPADELLEEAVAAARRAEPLPPATTTTLTSMAAPPRPSLVPLLIASVAVAAAGAAIAWVLSSDGEPPPPEVAAAPAQAPAPAPTPAPPPPIQVTAGVAAAVAPAAAAALDPRDAADRDAHRRRLRRDRDERPVRARDERPVALARAEPSAPAAQPARAAEAPAAVADPPRQDEAVRAAVDASNQKSTKTAAGSVVKGDLQPLPVPVPAPAMEPAHARTDVADRPRKAIVISPNRTRRESGTVPPIRFPRWEQAPSQLTAKLCIDTSGTVTSVSVISPVSQEVRSTVVKGLSQWKYRPVVEGDSKVPACFATTFRVRVD